MIDVDANGLSCPEPLMLLKKALDRLGSDGEHEISLLVDNKTALENCGRLARKKGCTVNVENNNGTYTLHIKRT